MMESVQPIESWLRTQADVVKQRGSMANYDGRYHERMEEAADRIRELEAELAALEASESRLKNMLARATIAMANQKAELDALRKQQGEPVSREALQNAVIYGTPPLYLEATPRVPEGWKLVPVEPTEEMCEAAITDGCVSSVDAAGWCYRAMLAVAPEPKE